jgi:hypothetical protein
MRILLEIAPSLLLQRLLQILLNLQEFSRNLLYWKKFSTESFFQYDISLYVTYKYTNKDFD